MNDPTEAAKTVRGAMIEIGHPPGMEMPINCTACGRWVELNDTWRCDHNEDLRCRDCYREWEHEQGTEGADDGE